MIRQKIFRIFFCLGSLLPVLFVCTLPATSAAERFEPPRYRITAVVDIERSKISATQDVTFTNNSPGPVADLSFHIYPHRRYTQEEKVFLKQYAGYFKVNPFPEGFPEPDFRVESVLHNQRPLEFTIEGTDETFLNVVLPLPLDPGETVRVQLNFTVGIPHAYGRFGRHGDIFTLSRWYPVLAVLGEHGWQRNPFYPFHRPFFSEASNYSVALTVPEDFAVVHSGVLKKEVRLDGKKTMSIESDLPIREFSLALSPRYQEIQEEWQGMTLKSFYLPGEESSAREALGFARDLMAFYTARFGPYPYKEFSIAPVHLGYGGEQMSNLIFIDTRVFELPGLLRRYFDFMVAHETGHQWFYNLIGINEYTQMWLEEGINSYFVLEYLEDKYGNDAEVAVFPEWFRPLERLLPNISFRLARTARYKMQARIGLDGPVVSDLASFAEPSTIFSLTYGKGSKILEMLKEIVGPETFERIFRRIFKEYRFRNLRLKDFIRICEEESGKSLEWFFEPWLRTNQHWDAAVARVQENKILLVNKGDIRMPTEARARFADGTQKEFVWDGTAESEEIFLKHSAAIERVELDPERKLLDLDRVNNTWPRRAHIKPVPLYLGFYDMSFFLPDDGYNLVFGPELNNNGLGFKASFQKPYDQISYAAADYEFSENILHTRAGYQLNNVFHSQAAVGFELANRADYDDGDEDLVSGKVYWRKELWPVAYGLTSINDHVSLYLIRNQGMNKTLLLGGAEEDRNLSYLKRNEAIAGANLHFERSSPYPDPHEGFKVDTILENSGHFLGATQSFTRTAVDASWYQPLTQKSTLAGRLKYGWGYPDDKNLFQLGGIEGLRGYDRKTVRGASAFLGSVELRFPIRENLRRQFCDNLFAVESLGAAVFFDAGQAWFNDFEESSLRKDAGLGLRATVSLGSFLEKMVVRADIGWAINDENEEDPRFWFGVGQAF